MDSDCVPCEPVSRAFACCVCGNTDAICIITDDVQGIQVCGGTNMGGCGNVLNENMFGLSSVVWILRVLKNSSHPKPLSLVNGTEVDRSTDDSPMRLKGTWFDTGVKI